VGRFNQLEKLFITDTILNTNMSKFYITTSIPYVNGEPHLGHALEFIYADVLARYARQQGVENVLFSTGTDEHGSKIAEKATQLGISPLELSTQNTKTFLELLKQLNISNDRFIRTTDQAHEQRAQLVWKDLSEHIYKKKYIGWYCVGCEEYVTETFAKENNGVCPNHNRPYEQFAEENYFFGLSKFNNLIKQAINDDSFKIIPTTKKNEILSIINEGLEDISISRPVDKLSWGVPVPGDESQVMYVWFEALLNYITVLGYPEYKDFSEFWPADVQVIGKDILRFHAAIWPGILLGLKLPLPKVLYVHGFVNVDGKKMGKSLGNSIAPSEIINKYGVDAFRYYFMRHMPSYNDGDFSWEKMENTYNNELANELGNAVGRVSAMLSKYQADIVGNIPEPNHDIHDYQEALDNCQFDRALDEVWEQVRGINQYIDTEKPWTIAKSGDSQHLQEVLAYCVGCLLEIADLLLPFMPETSTKIQNVFKDGLVTPLKEPLFPKYISESEE
jgi:methionyl-tRNA synthetase